MLRQKTIIKSKAKFLILLSVGLVLATVGVFFRPVHAQTWVEGHITTDTTWKFADSPYRVINDVTVDAGVKLTIEPGVKVEFADDFSLIVKGTLYAVGTSDKMIDFTSSRPGPSPGVWNTIKFIGGKTESFTIKYSIITYATNGITIATQDGYALIEKCEIHNNSENGIMLMGKNNVFIKGNTIKQNKNGIGTDNRSEHSGIIINNNTIMSNQENGIYLHSPGYYNIYNVTSSSNTISSNGANGIYLNVYGDLPDYDVSIYNVSFSSNIVSSNNENGIYLHIREHWRTYVYNVNFSSNIVSSNRENGIIIEAWRILPKISDIIISGNIISANYQKGIWVEGDINANLSRNSISHNMYGVFYYASENNLAKFNDIYGNTYGMNVTIGATVNAEYNYWGDTSGPYHLSLNPEGKGNSVNGDGIDLDFIPFLSAPYVSVLPPGAPSLSVTVTANPSTVEPGEPSTITVEVTDGVNPIPDATVTLSSDIAGTFSQESGSTDSNGVFTCTFTAPTVTSQTTCTITVDATKTGYLSDQSQTQVTVEPIFVEDGEGMELSWVLLAVVVTSIVVIAAALIVRRSKREEVRLEP